MSQLYVFLDKVAESPDLEARIQSIDADSLQSYIDSLLQIAAEAGVPVTQDELMAAIDREPADATIDELEQVSGGKLDPRINPRIDNLMIQWEILRKR